MRVYCYLLQPGSFRLSAFTRGCEGVESSGLILELGFANKALSERALSLGPVSDRARWLVCGSVRDSFESDTGLDALIGTHREMIRLYELLQFWVGR